MITYIRDHEAKIHDKYYTNDDMISYPYALSSGPCNPTWNFLDPPMYLQQALTSTGKDNCSLDVHADRSTCNICC